MEHKLIKTDNYLLVVSDEEIKEKDYIYWNNKVFKAIETTYLPTTKKIICHKPLNSAPYLDGVDVLPEFEDEVIGKPLDDYIRNKHTQEECIGFIDGYQKAKETYKYTEADLRKAVELARKGSVKDTYNGYGRPTEPRFVLDNQSTDEIIQSLKQPKLPIAFDSAAYGIGNDEDGRAVSEPRKITNSEGRREWVGTYKF